MKLKRAKPESRRYLQTARAEAAEATGQRVVDAFLERLLTQWFDEITLDHVAADAGVTVQTIVRRFGGKEGLLARAVERFGSQVNARRALPAGEVDRVIANLIDDYEQSGDAVIRLLATEPRYPVLKPYLDFGRSEHRQWVTGCFASVLEKLAAGERQKAIDVLVVATDVYTWKLLRRDMGRSVAATAGAMKNLVSNAIDDISKSNF